jgi:hypothetical protein
VLVPAALEGGRIEALSPPGASGSPRDAVVVDVREVQIVRGVVVLEPLHVDPPDPRALEIGSQARKGLAPLPGEAHIERVGLGDPPHVARGPDDPGRQRADDGHRDHDLDQGQAGSLAASRATVEARHRASW